ncbi:MAG: zinc ABC transporter substrate-binding protein [Deltaproteobacteria bacterium]|jgi:zinc transport system substrate-binding protein
MKKTLFTVFLIIFLCVPQETLARPLMVFVSIVPQKYFAEKIGGDLVEVSVMVEPGANPHTYEPKPKQMVALAKTSVYFAIGVPFETTWLEKIAATNPQMLVAHTDAGIKKIPMKAQHQKSELEQDHHGSKDPHVWLSPPLVIILAGNMLKAFLRVDPAHRSTYEKNHDSFIKEIVRLDGKIRATFKGKGKHVEFMVFHPAWGYFAQAYGLEQIPIELEGKQPKAAELQSLMQYAKERGIKVIFAQPQFSRQAAQAIADSLGGQIIFADPLAADWETNLLQVASKFKGALK